MPIPIAQLNTWKNQGGTTSSALAYAAIERALTAPTSPLRGKNITLFLQGSYRNHTNVHADSDIDVVCLFDDTQTTNSATLPLADQQRIAQGPPAGYLIQDLRRDVLSSLRSAFGTERVHDGRRAIQVNTGHGREADVVPAIRYLHYYSQFLLPPAFHEGIALLGGNQWIYNFPRQHIANGEAKNAMARTGGNYKPTVRLFKNARSKAVERGLLADGDAPSYFIEGMLYNVPDNLFTADAEDTFVDVFNHLDQSNLATLMSQNGIIPLVGHSSTQWQVDAAQRFLAGLRRLWNEWQ